MATVRIRFDTSELERLAVDFSEAPGRIQRKAPKVMQRAAFNIKFAMRRDLLAGMHNHGRTHIPDMSRQINYDQLDAIGLAYEIGIDKDGQGKLGNFAAFGSINNAPIFDHTDSMRREMPRLLRALGAVAEDSVFGGLK